MRRFEFTGDGASKFWEVQCEGTSVSVRFGRVGSNGQLQTKNHGTAEKAAAERDKLIREKTKKGYVETPEAKVDAKKRKTPPTAATPPPEMPQPAQPTESVRLAQPGWVDGGGGYQLKLDNGKLVCRNARGQTLGTVPKDVKEGEAAAQLQAVADWLDAHARECVSVVETWMLRSLPTPRPVLQEVWDDPSWRRALENAVVMPLDENGRGEVDGAGFFRGVDAARGIGIVNLDGETVWLDAPSVSIPHPILLRELDDFRSLSVELSLKQGVSQLFREIFRKPADLDIQATGVTDFRNGKFAQLNHALGLCRRLGYRVSGGSAATRVWEGGRVCDARFWVGSDEPMGETYTDALLWVDDKDRTMKLGDIGAVAFSEGIRMASAIYAGRVIPKEGENV